MLPMVLLVYHLQVMLGAVLKDSEQCKGRQTVVLAVALYVLTYVHGDSAGG